MEFYSPAPEVIPINPRPIQGGTLAPTGTTNLNPTAQAIDVPFTEVNPTTGAVSPGGNVPGVSYPNTMATGGRIAGSDWAKAAPAANVGVPSPAGVAAVIGAGVLGALRAGDQADAAARRAAYEASLDRRGITGADKQTALNNWDAAEQYPFVKDLYPSRFPNTKLPVAYPPPPDPKYPWSLNPGQPYNVTGRWRVTGTQQAGQIPTDIVFTNPSFTQIETATLGTVLEVSGVRYDLTPTITPLQGQQPIQPTTPDTPNRTPDDASLRQPGAIPVLIPGPGDLTLPGPDFPSFQPVAPDAPTVTPDTQPPPAPVPDPPSEPSPPYVPIPSPVPSPSPSPTPIPVPVPVPSPSPSPVVNPDGSYKPPIVVIPPTQTPEPPECEDPCIQDIRNKLRDMKKQPKDCHECDPEYAYQTITSGEVNNGYLSVPENWEAYSVEFQLTQQPSNAKKEWGGGTAPDVTYCGWWSYGISTVAGVRTPIQYDRMSTELPAIATHVAWTFYLGHAGIVRLTIRKRTN